MSQLWLNLTQNHTQPAAPQATLYPIEDQAIVSVIGPDSAKFMQGQFTCNVQNVSDDQYRRGACCNAKGRMLANFTLAQHAGDYLLSLHSTVAGTLLAHLKKYMVFFKSEMATTEWISVGIQGSGCAALLNQAFGKVPTEDNGSLGFEGGMIIKLPFEGGFELWLHPDTAESTLMSLLPQCALGSADAWAAHRIMLGLGLVTEHTVESFIPQMLNLGQTDAISFNKGCYTGQEIVARMQYLGKLKRHMHLVQARQPLDPCMTVHSPNKSSAIGEMVNISQDPNGNAIALAVIESQYLEDTLTAQSDEIQPVSIELLSLPYDPLETGE